MQSKKKSERNHLSWLSDYRRNSLKQYERTWKYWLEFLAPHDEEWLLAHKHDEDWGKHVVDFHRFLKHKKKERGEGFLSDNTAKVMTNGIRGYLSHIGIGLGLKRVQKVEISKVEEMPMKDFPFDLKTKQQLLQVADATEEYIISVGISLGLRIGDFKLFKRGDFEPLLVKTIPIPLGKIITKKEGIPAYPYLDGDAVYAIKRLLSQMDREGRTSSNERMLRMDERTINNRLAKLFKKAGLSLGEYRIRFHVLRKFLCDCLASVCSSDKWRWFVGKKASSPYVQSEGIEAYKRVLRLTQVNGSAQLKAPTKEIEELRKENERLKEALTILVKALKPKETLAGEVSALSLANSKLVAIPELQEDEFEKLVKYLFPKSSTNVQREEKAG